MKSWCRSCGRPCRVLTVRQCDECLTAIVDGLARIRREVPDPYGWLLPPGSTVYPEVDEPVLRRIA